MIHRNPPNHLIIPAFAGARIEPVNIRPSYVATAFATLSNANFTRHAAKIAAMAYHLAFIVMHHPTLQSELHSDSFSNIEVFQLQGEFVQRK